MSTLAERDTQIRGKSLAGDGQENHFLTFFLGEEEYGVDILRVQEIKGWNRATPIPDAADYVRGVINLRGTIVPIVDLRRRFQKEPVPDSSTTVVIVVKVAGEPGEKTIGMLVDAVSDVRKASGDDLKPAPELGTAQQGFVKGLATVDDAMIILLDIDRLLAVDPQDEKA